MKNEKILADEILSDEQLENVVGGYRSDFETVCKALGKHPSFNTLNDIRNILAKEYYIEVYSWNTGSKGDDKLAPAEFRVMRAPHGDDYTTKKLSLDQVLGIIKGDININSI